MHLNFICTKTRWNWPYQSITSRHASICTCLPLSSKYAQLAKIYCFEWANGAAGTCIHEIMLIRERYCVIVTSHAVRSIRKLFTGPLLLSDSRQPNQAVISPIKCGCIWQWTSNGKNCIIVQSSGSCMTAPYDMRDCKRLTNWKLVARAQLYITKSAKLNLQLHLFSTAITSWRKDWFSVQLKPIDILKIR